MAKKWIQKAVARMKEKGTLGKFGKATPEKINAAKKKGGIAEKRAIFAENMKKIANKKRVNSAAEVFLGGESKVGRKKLKK